MTIRELQLWCARKVNEHLTTHENDNYPDVVIVVEHIPEDAKTLFLPVMEHMLYAGDMAMVADDWGRERRDDQSD